MRGILSLIRRVFDGICACLFARKCAVCRVGIRDGALCSDCLSQVRKAIMTRCTDCGETIAACRCTALCHRTVPVYSLMPYQPGKQDAASRLLLVRKERLNPSLEDTIAQMMSPLCLCAAAEMGGDASEWIITWPPRSEKKRREVGHDQSEESARRLSVLAGMELMPCIARKHGANTAQKTLGAAQRAENAQDSFMLVPKYMDSLRGKRVILIDDIATTGATLSACASMLLEAGAACVVALTAAKTVHGSEKQP